MSSRGSFPAPKPSTASMVDEQLIAREPASESAGRTNAAYAPEERKPLPAAVEGQSCMEPAVVLRGSLLDDAEVDGESTMTYAKRPSQPGQRVAFPQSPLPAKPVPVAPESQATRPSVSIPRPRSVPPPSGLRGGSASSAPPVSLPRPDALPKLSELAASALQVEAAPLSERAAAGFTSVPPPSLFASLPAPPRRATGHDAHWPAPGKASPWAMPALAAAVVLTLAASLYFYLESRSAPTTLTAPAPTRASTPVRR